MLVALVGCQGSKKKKSEEPPPARSVDAGLASVIKRCQLVAERFVVGRALSGQMLRSCAPLFGEPSCRRALEKAGDTPSVDAGMAAINACKLAYCPKYTLAELCESKAPPTIRDAKRKFPRLAAEILEKEHADVKMLDSVAYLMVKPLLPTARQVYVRVVAKGDVVEVKIGEDGFADCETTKTLTIGKGDDLRSLDGPLLGPLADVARGVEPGLVELIVDPDEGKRVNEVAVAAGRHLQRRGMELVICRAKRANCPDVKKCP